MVLPYKRSERLKKLFHKEISDIVSHLKDPRIGFITITEVELSEDLKELKVYFSMLNKSEVETTQKALDHASGYVRDRLFHRLRLKRVPSISFIFDETPERATRIFKILDQLKNERSKKTQENNQ